MLFGSNILEIAIALFFVYMMLSMIASALNEWLFGLWAVRANTLRDGITNLLEDPVMKDLAKRFYAHPLIVKLGSPKKDRLPSYIAARTFSAVLLDLLPINDESSGTPTSLEKFRRLRATLVEEENKGSSLAHILLRLVDQVGVTPEQIETAQAFAAQLNATRKALAATSENIPTGQGENAINPLIKRMQDLEVGYKTLEDEVSDSLEQARRRIEIYFDQAMERLAGGYRRHSQWWLIIIALIVTFLLNVDTLALISRLSVDDELRTALVERAAAATAPVESESTSGVTNTVPSSVTSTITNTESSEVTDSGTMTTTSASSTTTPVNIQNALEVIDSLKLPIGWSTDMPMTLGGWLTKVMGLLITAMAASMGAPFWYDVLSKITNVRLAGRPPASLVPTSPPAEPN